MSLSLPLISELGALLGARRFPATALSYRQLPGWAARDRAACRRGVHRLLQSGADPPPHRGGPVEMIRMFKLAKASAIKSRTQAIDQLKSVLVSAA